MSAVNLTVYTKAGATYVFDSTVPGSAVSALTQLTSEQDIHAKGLKNGSQAEFYIPYCAVEFAVVTRSGETTPVVDNLCDKGDEP